MRRFAIALTCFMLMFTLMPFAGALAESGDDVVVVYPTDEFIAEHADDAISCADSQAFDVGFCVLEPLAEDMDASSPGATGVMFNLVIESKLDKPIYDLKFNVHFGDMLNAAIINAFWENEPLTLYPPESGKIPRGLNASKGTYIRHNVAQSLGGITFDDLYNVYVEVTWREGLSDKHSEIWDMSQTGYQAAVDWYNSLPEDAPERQSKLIDEDYLAAINDKAKALSN